MSDARKSQAGSLLANRTVTVTVPNIADGDHADVDLAADAAFAGGASERVAVDAAFKGLPLDNLGILGAWVKTPTTGVVTVRFAALSGAVATDDQDINVQRRA